MSNGVEVIVASDKGKPTQKQSIFRILPSNLYRPLTLAPSTLKDQMILIMPSESKDNFTIPINPNQFVTKTCLTTYTYRTTYLQNGTTTVESQEQVISNIATEERNYMKISPTASFGVTLSRTPELAIGVFHTTYTYLNTILDGDQSLVVSSRHTVTNTITAPDDYIGLLQPSEEATPIFETNTYYSKILITKTLKDSNIHKVISTSNILTQVIVTESLSPKSMSAINPYAEFDVDETADQITDLVKTQYVTYTYYNTIVDNEGSLSVQTIVSASPDVITEKLFLYKQKPSAEALIAPSDFHHSNENVRPTIFTDHHVYSTAMATNSINIFNPAGGEIDLNNNGQKTIHIYATKTYLTTFTYFTTLLKSNENEISSTIVSSHTRIIENVITESIPNYLLNSQLLEHFSQELINSNGKHAIITTATLIGGQSLEVTAINVLKPTAIIKTANIESNQHNTVIIPSDHTHIIDSTIPDLENCILENVNDSDVAESELNDEIYADEYADATKIGVNSTKTAIDKVNYPSSPTNGLIGSFNLNGLTALGPVINAMADLIQNNFGNSATIKRNVSTTVVKHHHHHHLHHHHPGQNNNNIGESTNQQYRNVTLLNAAIDSDSEDQSHRSPIYIPVRDEKISNFDHQRYSLNQGDFYNQPIPASLQNISPPDKWIIGDEKMNRNNKLEFPLSKPTHETPLLNGGIPISPGEVITANSDVIVGKPAGTRPRIPFNTKLKESTINNNGAIGDNSDVVKTYLRGKGDITPNIIPLNRYQNHDNIAADKHFENFIRPPPPLAPPQQFLQKQSANSYQGLRVPQQVYHRNTYSQHVNKNPHMIPLLHPPPQPPIGDILGLNKGFIANNEILEIKRIPEVYSTDLPPVEIGYQHHHVQKIISTEKPMLVNIQPSQVANVVIPHGGSSNSVLIIESTAELHKNGHYFDEPPPYPDVGINNNNKNKHNNKNILPFNKPVLTNQQINLDSHVLSHNVDIHVPPITFKKENDFPHSTPIRGHIQNNGPIHMAHVNIPATDHEIEVKLTPHHVSLPNSYLQDQSQGHNIHQQVIRVEQNHQQVPNRSAQEGTSSTHQMIVGNDEQYNPTSDDISVSASSSLLGVSSHTRTEEKPLNISIVTKENKEKNSQILPLLKSPQITGYGNKQYTSGLEYGSYRKPQSTYLHQNYPSHQNYYNYNPLKRRPAGFQFNQMKNNGVNIKQKLPLIPIQHPESDIEKNIYYLSDSIPSDTISNDPPKDSHYSHPSMIDGSTYNQNYNHSNDNDDIIDDYENEEGEVVQESNSLPVLTGQYLINRLESNLLHKGTVISFETNTTTDKIPIKSTTSSSIIDEEITTHQTMVKIKDYPYFMHTAINSLGKNNFTIIPNLPLSPQQGRPFTPLPGHTIIPPSIAPYRHTEHIPLRQGEMFKKHPQIFNKTKLISSNSPTSLHKVSLSIDPGKEVDNDTENLSQTEAPFNPKYTTTLKTTKTTTKFRVNTQNKFFNKIKDSDKDSVEEIFDFKETINPHNLGVINNLDDFSGASAPMTTVKTLTSPQYSGHNHKKSTTIQKKPGLTATTYPYISKPSVNMKPPPVQPTVKKVTAAEVMGLSPPPLPVSMSPPPSQYKYSSVGGEGIGSIPQFPSHSTGSAGRISQSQQQHKQQPPPSTTTPPKQLIKQQNQEQFTYNFGQKSNTIPTAVTTSTIPPSTKKLKTTKSPTTTPKAITTTVKQKGSTSFNMVLMPEILIVPLEETRPSSSSSTSSGPNYTPGKETTPPPTISSTTKRQNSKEVTKSNQDDKILNPENETERPNEMFHPDQRIPDEIMIMGSELEESLYNPSTILSSNILQQQHPTLLSISTKTRLVNKIVLPTKYITNTKTLTVTTTKTTVVKSQGIPSTRTLIFTKTKTSTIVDTITQTAKETATETQTHTLLQPTKVTISSPPEIRTTITTVYTLPEYQNYPVFSSSEEKVSSIPEKVDDAVLLFVEDSEGSLDELIINYNDLNQTTTTTTEPNSIDSTIQKSSTQLNRRPTQPPPTENESIFVVMTDKKNSPGLIRINTSNFETIDDPDYDLPSRDEDPEMNGPNHVLLGGILIATPPKQNNGHDDTSQRVHLNECRPDCKAARNELCQRIEGSMKCVCRPGFARMFPDRPCKPTYTYSLTIPIYRFGKERLLYDAKLSDPMSDEFLHWAGVTHDALDRMVMQSDFRDVYHGVHVTGFKRDHKDNGVVGNFYLQLSDNSDENRLVDVFRKYLRSNNYSIGGTDLHTVKSGVDELKAKDFNECLDTKFHDCSENSQCFNLHGTYTCSCKNGYADLSENPVYPGRKCSADLIGCEKCNYHGTCYAPNGMEQPICDCFHWYAGESCQVNLKILLIALIAIGASLLVLLFFCILVTCSKRKRSKSPQSLIAGINILPPKGNKAFNRNLKIEKRAMIKDSSSEISQSNTLPYVSKDTLKKHSTTSSQNLPLNSQSVAAAEAERRCNLLDQNDRSLTVMIPRAKYHPGPHQNPPPHVSLEVPMKSISNEIISASAESKILSYLDASGSKRNSSASLKQHHPHCGGSAGALVSAGFEVSATVGQEKGKDDKNIVRKKYSNSDENFIDSMDNWLDTMQQNELTVSEARSYDETTVQPPTKSLRSIYEKQLSQMNNDEANTMAERDVGSTFLLPHTHLYKPDRGSDISGFDSF